MNRWEIIQHYTKSRKGSNSLTLIVPDEGREGYYRNASCMLNLLSMFLFFTNIRAYFMKVIPEMRRPL
jgi:hypothetical protein